MEIKYPSTLYAICLGVARCLRQAGKQTAASSTKCAFAIIAYRNLAIIYGVLKCFLAKSNVCINSKQEIRLFLVTMKSEVVMQISRFHFNEYCMHACMSLWTEICSCRVIADTYECGSIRPSVYVCLAISAWKPLKAKF